MLGGFIQAVELGQVRNSSKETCSNISSFEATGLV